MQPDDSMFFDAPYFLTRLIDHAHAAASETFKDFKLWKMRGDIFGWQRWLSGGRVAGESGLRFQVQRHEAVRAESGGSAFADGRATLRTF